jgi:transcriptional regulator GlxA family with amidase domain
LYNVGILLFNDIELLDFAGPYEVFSVASELHGYQQFTTYTISEDGQTVQTVNGLKVVPDYSFQNNPPIDILIIPGGVGTKAEMEKPTVLDWVSSNIQTSRLTFAVCSGARILGKLGLLDHCEVTTHHEVIPHLQEIAPKASINPEARFVDNGRLMTSAGISAGIDLSLHVVEKLYGREVVTKTVAYLEYGDWKNYSEL